MPARVSEAIVLRTYPLREADLIVSFLTRDQGKLRGVAHRARRLKSSFGSGLERLSQVEMSYFQRENRELVNLNSCELIRSQFSHAGDYAVSVVLDYFAEVADQLLPLAEPNEKFYRLLVAMLRYLGEARSDGVWPAVTYFSLWSVRLAGFLPQIEGSPDEVSIAEEMLRKPVGEITPRTWSKQTGARLRRFLIRQIEEHIERQLRTVRYLEEL
jgi:DNA repair protein RecO (recombination protein O)